MSEGVLVQIIIAVTTLGGLGVGGVFALRKTRGEGRKLEVDAAQVAQAMTLALVQPLEKRAAKLVDDLGEAEGRIERLVERLDQAVALLRQHGIPLPWEDGS